jgi:hypothetical protein
MIASFVPRAFGPAIGIADADRVEANAKAQAAIPINESRFMFPPRIAIIAAKEEVLSSSSSSDFGAHSLAVSSRVRHPLG